MVDHLVLWLLQFLFFSHEISSVVSMKPFCEPTYLNLLLEWYNQFPNNDCFSPDRNVRLEKMKADLKELKKQNEKLRKQEATLRHQYDKVDIPYWVQWCLRYFSVNECENPTCYLLNI